MMTHTSLVCQNILRNKIASTTLRAYSSITVNRKWERQAGMTHHKASICRHSDAPLLCAHHVGNLTLQRHFNKETLAYYLSAENPPIRLAQEVLHTVHDFTGLPWWATILLTTVGLRSVMTIPLSIFTQHNSARLERLQEESGKKARQLKAEIVAGQKKYDWTEREMHRLFKMNMKRIMREMYQRDNCHPLKNTIVIWVQIPLWISMSLALRNMSGSLMIKGAENVVTAPSLATEGFLWFPDLLACDTTWILPVAVGLFNLMNIEIFNLEATKVTRLRKIITNTLRVLSVVLVPIAANVPSCMAFYWACSGGFSLGQNIIFKSPSFRRLCKIPKVPSESQTPYSDLRERAIEKYIMRKKKA